MDEIVSLSKRRGFVYPSSEIYGGLANTWDYGPIGTLMKNNIKNEWIKFFVNLREDMLLIDSAILLNPMVWKASGHLENFTDPMTDCLSCKKRFRADHLLEEILKIKVEGLSTKDMTKLLKDNKIKCPNCGGELTDVRYYNLMFQTKIGPIENEDNSQNLFLRPETAQGIFINFDNIIKSNRVKIPFGVAQIGKSFRNEITAGNFIFRILEPEIMELEYFVREGKDMEFFEDWLSYIKKWYQYIGIKDENLKYVEIDENERAHYSKRTVDVYFNFPFGFKELSGLANRGDYDLKRHSEFSGKELSILDENTKDRYIPFVIEPSFGLDRLFLALLCDSYSKDEVAGEERIFLKLSHKVSPYQVAIFPLMKKDKIDDIAYKIYKELKLDFRCVYDDGGSIGKRYRRQDEIGTCKCITVDSLSLNDDTVTIRDRDTMKQTRHKIKDLKKILNKCFM